MFYLYLVIFYKYFYKLFKKIINNKKIKDNFKSEN